MTDVVVSCDNCDHVWTDQWTGDLLPCPRCQADSLNWADWAVSDGIELSDTASGTANDQQVSDKAAGQTPSSGHGCEPRS